ncbi:hypothetical protein OROMI_027923 [Orobanche minor]
MTMAANSIFTRGIPMRSSDGKRLFEPDDERLIRRPQVKKSAVGPMTRARARKPCHKHGLVNCTLEMCPLPRGYGYLIEYESSTDPSYHCYSSFGIAYMGCDICEKMGDHWYIDCPKYKPVYSAQKRPAATASNSPTDDFRAGLWVRRHAARLKVTKTALQKNQVRVKVRYVKAAILTNRSIVALINVNVASKQDQMDTVYSIVGLKYLCGCM